jgi:hypothetical protein
METVGQMTSGYPTLNRYSSVRHAAAAAPTSGPCSNRQPWERAVRRPNSQSREDASCRVGDETIGRYDEAIFLIGEDIPKHAYALMAPAIQQRGAIMLVLILNAIYHKFLRAALAGMPRQGGKP